MSNGFNDFFELFFAKKILLRYIQFNVDMELTPSIIINIEVLKVQNDHHISKWYLNLIIALLMRDIQPYNCIHNDEVGN